MRRPKGNYFWFDSREDMEKYLKKFLFDLKKLDAMIVNYQKKPTLKVQQEICDFWNFEVMVGSSQTGAMGPGIARSDRSGQSMYESVNEEIAVGKMVKVVDNPHWEAALGKKGPFKRKVKMIDGENVFFTDGSNSSMKYVKESVSSLNEEKYTIIDPMGNQMGAGERTQVMLAAKKKGGVQSGYFVVSVKNALKAKRALEKFKGDFKNPKLKDMMSNLFYESVNESHFKVGDKVEMSHGSVGVVKSLDKEDGADDEKYYNIELPNGDVMKHAPNELKLVESKINKTSMLLKTLLKSNIYEGKKAIQADGFEINKSVNEAITLKSPTFKKLVTYLQKISDESGNDWNDLVKKLESKYARLDTYTSGANPAAYVVNFFYIIKGKDEFVKKRPQDFVKIGNWYVKPWPN
jgi:hypothetical protein